MDCAGEYLPEPVIRSMIDSLQGLAEIENDRYVKRNYLRSVACIWKAEITATLASAKWRASDAKFMIAIGKIDEAEEFLLGRADLMSGENYGALLSLAKTMESEKRNLATSMIYRCLLTTILENGRTKAYAHGVRYLKKLDFLAPAIKDWRDFAIHEAFKELLYQGHGRKRSFWSKYEEKK